MNISEIPKCRLIINRDYLIVNSIKYTHFELACLTIQVLT